MPIAGIAVRGVEALIDLVVCYVLLYSIAAIGGTTVKGGGIYLHNAPLMMAAGLCFRIQSAGARPTWIIRYTL